MIAYFICDHASDVPDGLPEILAAPADLSEAPSDFPEWAAAPDIATCLLNFVRQDPAASLVVSAIDNKPLDQGEVGFLPLKWTFDQTIRSVTIAWCKMTCMEPEYFKTTYYAGKRGNGLNAAYQQMRAFGLDTPALIRRILKDGR